MNKIFYITFTFVLLALFLACDPITDVQSMGTKITSADQIQATVTPILSATGKKINKVKVHCTSLGSPQWTNGVNTLCSSDTTLTLFFEGNNTVTLSSMQTDGTILTKSYTAAVDTLAIPVPAQYGYFCGTGVKKWVWATDNTVNGASNRIWGNGGNTDSAPGWWGRTAADAADDNIDVTGYMEFTLNGLKFTRVENGVTTTGTFSFDMSVHKFSQCIGQVTFAGTTILHGISQNDGKKVVYVFNIIKLSNDEMELMYATDSNTYEGWFWLFKRNGYTY